MRRIAAVILLVLGTVLWRSSPSPTVVGAANTTATPRPTPFTPVPAINGFCIVGPANQIGACPTTPTPVPALPSPIKLLSVGGGIPEPDGVTQYTVNVTTSAVCFPAEPVTVYALSNPGAAVLGEMAVTGTPAPPTPTIGANQPTPKPIPTPTVTPTPPIFVAPAQGPNAITVTSGPPTFTNPLSLEVLNSAVGDAGVFVRAVWPVEGIDHEVEVIPAAPRATATPVPGQPTPTPSPTVQPVPVPPHFFVRACVTPNPVAQGGAATLFVESTPGAVCRAALVAGGGPVGTIGTGPVGGSQTVPSGMILAFPFTANVATTTGKASVTCTYHAETMTTTTTFGVTLPPPAPPPISNTPCSFRPGVSVGASLSNPFPVPNEDETVTGCFFLNGLPVANVPMTARFQFQSGPASCASITNFTGEAVCTVNIDNAPPGTLVLVTVTFLFQGAVYSVTLGFIPKATH